MKTLAEIQVETQAQLNVAKWMVMIYFAVSSDLDNEAMADLRQLRGLGSLTRSKSSRCTSQNSWRSAK
jgi:hypothetical protein